MGREGSGEAETGSKWSDGFSGGFGMGCDQTFLEKNEKQMKTTENELKTIQKQMKINWNQMKIIWKQ